MRVLSALSCLAAGAHAAAITPFEGKSSTDLDSSSASTLASTSGQPHVLQARATDYWLEQITHQGIASFNNDPAGYKVWRNVKDFGAIGDGVHDDTDAINSAISQGGRCAPFVCQSSSVSPATVYFPAGTYLVKKPIVMYYMTTLMGNPNNRAVIKPSSDFTDGFVIDGSPYGDWGREAWVNTNIFMRQIRNLVVDLTAVPVTQQITGGIHWQASQATSIQFVEIKMTVSSDSKHTGLFVENGSGGWMVDIKTTGGYNGIRIGNQQFTLRNIEVHNAVTGIYQLWSWGWLYQGVHIYDCQTAIDIGAIDDQTHQQAVGSIVVIDSSAENCNTFVRTSWTMSTSPPAAGQLILENVDLKNVQVGVQSPDGTRLAGGDKKIVAWGQGWKIGPGGSPQRFQGDFKPLDRPAGLLDSNGKFFSKEKPQYEWEPRSSFLSVRDLGAKGDGSTDDTTAVQNAINTALAQNKILFFDHGNYIVTKTILFPAGTRIVGEMFAVILAKGSTWADKSNPVPVIKIGNAGNTGSIVWTDMIVATKGPTPGAILIEYNLASDRGSGLYDVHTRIGGAKGTDLQTTQCPISKTQNDLCLAAHTNVHVTKSAKGAYFENNWFWTADHDFDDVINNSTRVSVFTGRGLLVEADNVFLYGNGVEHHAIYQYQFANSNNVFAGYIQTETPYWQPNPDARTQKYYPRSDAWNDPNYDTLCPANEVCDALGLRLLNTTNVRIYAGGVYSFFNNYDVSCSDKNAPNGRRECQNRIVSIEKSSGYQIYGLSNVGAKQMLTIDGQDRAPSSGLLSVYSNTLGLISS